MACDSLLLCSQEPFMSRWIKSTSTLFLKIQCNVRPSTTSFSKWSLPLKFIDQILRLFLKFVVTAETLYAKTTMWSYGLQHGIAVWWVGTKVAEVSGQSVSL